MRNSSEKLDEDVSNTESASSRVLPRTDNTETGNEEDDFDKDLVVIKKRIVTISGYPAKKAKLN